MTSKEKLLKLRHDFYNNKELNYDSIDYFTTIEKELEVLEIFKNEADYKKIIERNGIATFHLDMVLTEDNYFKIKEWLEDDK